SAPGGAATTWVSSATLMRKSPRNARRAAGLRNASERNPAPHFLSTRVRKQVLQRAFELAGRRDVYNELDLATEARPSPNQAIVGIMQKRHDHIDGQPKLQQLLIDEPAGCSKDQDEDRQGNAPAWHEISQKTHAAAQVPMSMPH